MIVEPGTTHGLDDIAWDDASMPASFWERIHELPTGCWVPKAEDSTLNFRETIVTRLLQVEWRDVFSAVPTCGNIRCVRASHLCVVLRTELSAHPRVRST